MEVYDIRRKILSKLDTGDYKDIISMCSIDTAIRNLCSQKYFWNTLLKEAGLPTSTYDFKNVNEWILEFHKIKVGYQRALSLLDKLENRQLAVPFKIGDEIYELDEDEANDEGLEISFKHCPIPDLFIVDGVDENIIRFVYNNYVADVYSLTEIGYPKDLPTGYTIYSEGNADSVTPAIQLKYINKKFYLQIIYSDIHAETGLYINKRFNISKDNMILILYNLLSHGIIPRNTGAVLFPY